MQKIFTNCRVITRTDLFIGSVVVDDGIIVEVDDALYHGDDSVDLNGDLLLPGLIEMHTDNLEKNLQPRPGVIWPSTLAAALSHDAQIIGAGITTVFDAVAVGGLRESSMRSKLFTDSVNSLCKGGDMGLFKADHFLHMRCEIANATMEKMLMEHIDRPQIRLLSIMDHTPGQRQWIDLKKWRQYYRDKKWTDSEAEAILEERRQMQTRYANTNRKLALTVAKERGIPLASHDDTTALDVISAASEGITISEFPTTIEAAAEAREKSLKTIMGAPNAVRGESHSGNVTATALAQKGLLDGLSSDYVPNSLLHAAFTLSENLKIELPTTIAMVSCDIADMVGMNDRGEIRQGKIADMLQVQLVDDLPVIKRVWKKGEIVA